MESVSKVTDDPKRRDMKRDIVDCTSETGLTTDHGVKISDTDNWYIIPYTMHICAFNNCFAGSR